MTRIGAMILAVFLSTVVGCAYVQSTLDKSSQYQEFCRWSPVAIAAIGQAVIESSNDPSKHEATRAMSQALVFLKLAAAQCPPVTP